MIKMSQSAHKKLDNYCKNGLLNKHEVKMAGYLPIFASEAALLLISTKNRNLWVVPTREVCDTSRSNISETVAIPGADQKERGLWGWEWILAMFFLFMFMD